MNNSVTISMDFIKDLKRQIVLSRYIVAKIANEESLKLYFAIGKALDEQLKNKKWGAKVLGTVSERLQKELPGLRGFSASNLKKMRLFYQAWEKTILISSTLLNQFNVEDINNFLSISFSHHLDIFTAVKGSKEAWFYINKTAAEFWTVRQLRLELKNKSHLQEQKLPNNINKTLTTTLSNKAIRAFKDQYLLDFINIEDADEDIDERVLEHEIVQNIKKFMMSLGSDFSFMGNQYR